LFQKVLSVTICILYLSLSLLSISCAYHCEFNDELPESPKSHDHQHHSNDNQQNDSDHRDVLFCKFVHKVGSSVITVSQIVIAALGFSIQVAPFNNVVVYQRIDIIHLSRGPPSVLS